MEINNEDEGSHLAPDVAIKKKKENRRRRAAVLEEIRQKKAAKKLRETSFELDITKPPSTKGYTELEDHVMMKKIRNCDSDITSDQNCKTEADDEIHRSNPLAGWPKILDQIPPPYKAVVQPQSQPHHRQNKNSPAPSEVVVVVDDVVVEDGGRRDGGSIIFESTNPPINKASPNTSHLRFDCRKGILNYVFGYLVYLMMVLVCGLSQMQIMVDINMTGKAPTVTSKSLVKVDCSGDTIDRRKNQFAGEDDNVAPKTHRRRYCSSTVGGHCSNTVAVSENCRLVPELSEIAV
ncbi:hypothetical protein LXL04_015071 [Taraxacum kok-saghyz]